jgi:hypothetical protein
MDVFPLVAENVAIRSAYAPFLSCGYSRCKRKVPLPAVQAEGHAGSVSAGYNAVLFAGADAGEMVCLGKGSGQLPVEAALLNAGIGLFHPSHSWTGRFPRSGSKLRTPRFAPFLTREGGTSALSDAAEDGSIPLLDSLIWPHGH